MRSLVFLSAALALTACKNDTGLTQQDQTPVIADFGITSPTYGAFLGDGPIQVTGYVSPVGALVEVEGEAVTVQADGSFAALVPFDDEYRIVDVEATIGEDHRRERVPVFAGRDPMETWPGALALRVTPDGLGALGRAVGGAVIDLLDTVPSMLPPVEASGFWLGVTALSQDGVDVDLLPLEEGIDLQIDVAELALEAEMRFEVFGETYTIPMSIGYDTLHVASWANPRINDDGMITLELAEPEIVLADADASFAGVDVWLAEIILDGVGFVLEPLTDILVANIVENLGEIELYGPLTFDTELLGHQLSLNVNELESDLDGLGLGAQVGIDQPAGSEHLRFPMPVAGENGGQVVLAVHEGIVQMAASEGGLFDEMLGDFELPDYVGGLIGAKMEQLPGGDDAPDTTDWCLELELTSARAARLQPTVSPLAVIYLPDLGVKVGTYADDGSCELWLDTSLALEANLVVSDGDVLGLDLVVAEGAVNYYGATDEWTEEAVVQDMGDFLQTAFGLLAGSFNYDLSELLGGLVGGDATDGTEPGVLDALLGGLFGELEPQILSSEPMVNRGGQQIDGLYAISVNLWED